jgi:hypothetical protein
MRRTEQAECPRLGVVLVIELGLGLELELELVEAAFG